MPVRVGVIGRGFGRRVLAPAFTAAGAEIVFVCGKDAWRRSIKTGGVDAVVIAVPGGAQGPVVSAALKSGLAVFCEKPLAESLSKARALALAARRARRPAMIDFEFPETTAWKEAKRFSIKGLGRLRHAVLNWQVETNAGTLGPNSWKNKAARGGGALNIFGSHAFHNIEWLFGPVQSVLARLRHGPACDRGATLLLKLSGGATVSADLGTDAFMGSGHRLEAYGEAGSFILENFSADYMTGFSLRTASRRSRKWKTAVAGRAPRRGEDGRAAPVARLAGRFLSWLKTGSPAAPDLSYGVRAQELIAAARLSDRTGRAVEVGHVR